MLALSLNHNNMTWFKTECCDSPHHTPTSNHTYPVLEVARRLRALNRRKESGLLYETTHIMRRDKS
jgi:hypothetical protein